MKRSANKSRSEAASKILQTTIHSDVTERVSKTGEKYLAFSVFGEDYFCFRTKAVLEGVIIKNIDNRGRAFSEKDGKLFLADSLSQELSKPASVAVQANKKPAYLVKKRAEDGSYVKCGALFQQRDATNCSSWAAETDDFYSDEKEVKAARERYRKTPVFTFRPLSRGLLRLFDQFQLGLKRDLEVDEWLTKNLQARSKGLSKLVFSIHLEVRNTHTAEQERQQLEYLEASRRFIQRLNHYRKCDGFSSWHLQAVRNEIQEFMTSSLDADDFAADAVVKKYFLPTITALQTFSVNEDLPEEFANALHQFDVESLLESKVVCSVSEILALLEKPKTASRRL